jgi:hypothetical protein
MTFSDMHLFQLVLRCRQSETLYLLDLTEDFPLVTKQNDAPAALHPAGELRGTVFLGAEGWHPANLGGRRGESSRPERSLGLRRFVRDFNEAFKVPWSPTLQ